MLPDTWTIINNHNGLQLGFKLKLLGVDWRSEDEFGRIMVYLEKIGMMLRELAERLRIKIADHEMFIGENRTLKMTTSIGIATSPGHGDSW